jgi:tetratricopeptide (TPR) repeat protein
MTSRDAYSRLQVAMKAELARNMGRIREIESGLSRSEGYLSRFCRGELSIPLEVLLKTLDLLGTDPGQFFSKALGAPPDPGIYLDGLVDDNVDEGVEELRRVALALRLRVADHERCSPFFPRLVEDPKGDKTAALLDDMVRCSGIEQRRRLRSADRYRQPGFVVAYLRHLDLLRYDHPREAVKLLQVVGCELIPEVEARPIERQVLCLYAIAIFGSACRIQGDLATAAACQRFALEEAMASQSNFLIGDLLRRAACVLYSACQYQQGLDLLGDALVLYDELDLEEEVGKVQVLRGTMYNSLGDALSAARVLRKALRRLGEDSAEMRPFRGAAYQQLAIAYENAGDTEAAEEHLRHALAVARGGSASQAAEMVWYHGWLAFQRGDLAAAERRLRDARAQLQEPGGLAFALVSLDLARVLLVRGQGEEAMKIAQEMASLLRGSKKTAAIEQSLLGFVRLALEGRLTGALIERFGRELQKQGARRPGALLQP